MDMGKIGVMADKETSIYFKLGGVKNTWVVKSQEAAVKTFDEIKAKQLVSLVIATEPVFDWIKDRLGKSKKEIELPLVVSIPTFFFQAEDVIRDVAVTGVQTCALPI